SPEIKISVAGAIPETLYNGYNQTLDLLIQNVGGGIAKNVSIGIIPGIGTQVISSANHFFFGAIMPGSSESEQVLISSDSNASNASIIAHADYYSANYEKEYSADERINITLAPSAQFEAVAEASELAPGATDVPLTFILRNNGNEEATNVQLSLQSTYPITPVASTYYISSIAPGSSANVTFLVSADTQAAPGNYPVTIYEQWKQPNGAVNQEYYGTTNYFAKISAYSGESGAEWGVGIVLILAIVIAVYVARNRRRHRKK
ncbi:MAG: CARDB domain-containing protein, partial [Candidatus Micrarchaeaceae archaeon]